MTYFEGLFVLYGVAAAIMWPLLVRQVPNMNSPLIDSARRKQSKRNLLAFAAANMLAPVLVTLSALINRHYEVLGIGLALLGVHSFYLWRFIRAWPRID